MESTWNDMDSRWNGFTKMAEISPKTYSIWNDMDSTWIPCGMWGEGKDLWFLAVSGIGRTSYSYGLRHWAPKDQTGLDFQTLMQKVLNEWRACIIIQVQYFNIIFSYYNSLTTLKTSLKLVRNQSEPQLVQTGLETAKNCRRPP